MSKTVRKQLVLDEKVEKKLAEEAKRMGISQSSLMSVALDFYFYLRDSKMSNNCPPKKQV